MWSECTGRTRRSGRSVYTGNPTRTIRERYARQVKIQVWTRPYLSCSMTWFASGAFIAYLLLLLATNNIMIQWVFLKTWLRKEWKTERENWGAKPRDGRAEDTQTSQHAGLEIRVYRWPEATKNPVGPPIQVRQWSGGLPKLCQRTLHLVAFLINCASLYAFCN